MDEAEDEPLRISVIAAEFPTASAAEAAYKNLDTWIFRGERDASAYRLSDETGTARLVVAVVLTDSGHAEPIARRLKRRGGTLRDIPEPDKRALIERTIEAGSQGLVGRRSYEIALPLSGAQQNPDLN